MNHEKSIHSLDSETMLYRFVKWLHSQPELTRVVITAAVGTVLAWITYEVVYALNGLAARATTSWVIAFTIGIFRQHHLHRTLSFPAARLSYGDSLRREVLASITVIVASAGLNYALAVLVGLHHRLAWIACLVSVAMLEYALMKLFVFRSRRSQARQ